MSYGLWVLWFVNLGVVNSLIYKLVDLFGDCHQRGDKLSVLAKLALV